MAEKNRSLAHALSSTLIRRIVLRSDRSDSDSESEWVDIPEGDAVPQTSVPMSEDEWVDIPEGQLTGMWLDGVPIPQTPAELF